MADITDYLREKIAEVRLARLLGEAMWGLGAIASVAGLLLSQLAFTAIGFPMLFAGLVLSVHYEFRLRDYMHTLEDFGRQEK